MVDVLIALGSNVGDSIANLREATALLGLEISVKAASHVYETEPMYVHDQPLFLNAAVLGQTDLGPRQLLARLKTLEQHIGRIRGERNGPREIDLDLIAYGRIAYTFIEGKDVRLTVPHPRVAERRFVLQPVADIASDYLLPGIGHISELLKQTEAQSNSVKKTEHAILPVQRFK